MKPRSVVALAALLIGLVLTGVYYVISPAHDVSQSLLFFGLSFVISGAIIYGIIHFYLSERLIPIYRTILGMTSKDSEVVKVDIMTNPIERAEQDATNWADQRIAEVRELQAKDVYRREFIGNLAHELKTPLFNIQGYVSSLLEGAMEDEKVREKFLAKASRNIDRMTRMIEDLDTITRFEHDSMELDIAEMDIVKCTKEVIESLEEKIASRMVTVTIKRKAPLLVMGDDFRISQVLTNLINNAITYGEVGGKVDIDYSEFGGRILIEVSDDGPGIQAAKLPRIFERFYRVDESRSRDIGGSGLGLAITKHILEAHGQSIHAKSKVGEGSVFSFTLAEV